VTGGAQLSGGASSASYTGTIVDNDNAPVLPGSATTVTVDESHLASGSHVPAGGLSESATASNSFTLHPDEVATLRVQGPNGQPVPVTDGLVVQGEYGYITFHVNGGTVSYDYTLTKAYGHTPNTGADQLAAGADQFALSVLGAAIGNINVGIEDDAPVLSLNNPANVTLDVQNGFATDGSLSIDFGADGAAGTDRYVEVEVGYTYTHNGSPTSGQQVIQLPTDGSHVTVATATGVVELYLENGEIKYSYEAHYGFQGDTEQIRFTVHDKDGDAASQSLSLNMSSGVPAAVFSLDEAGLSFGSQAPGHGDATAYTSLSGHALLADATEIVWNTAELPTIRADGNLDGNYANVTWQQDGNVLKGYADGQLVLSVVPEFDSSGHFTGNMSTTLYRPLQHGAPGSATDDSLGMDLSFTQRAGAGVTQQGLIRVDVRDDSPERADSGSGQKTLEIAEAHAAQMEVYLVLDVSSSVGNTGMDRQVTAIRALAQQYLNNGIDGDFTVIVFRGGAAVILSHVTAQELLAAIDDRGDLLQLSTDGTHYSPAVDALMLELAFSMNDPLRHDIPKTVYFLSDGAPTGGYWTATQQAEWAAYRNAHSDNLDVYALGIGTSASVNNTLATITGDASHVVAVTDYNALEGILVGMVPQVVANIFDVMGSADVGSVVDVSINGVLYALNQVDSNGLHHTGPITLPNGAVIDIYENGNYVLRTEHIDDDFTATISFTVRDADGDEHTTEDMTLLVRDSVPVASDDVSYMSTLTQNNAELLGSFNSTATHEGWVTTRDTTWNSSIPAANRGAFDAALISRVQSEYGITLNAGNYTNNNYGLRLQAEARTTAELSTTAPYDVIDAVVTAAGGHVTGYPATHKDMTLAAHEVVSRGGEILVSWGLYGRYNPNGSEQDGCLYILLDEDNEVIASGVWMPTSGSTGNFNVNGVWTITIPETGIEQTYKLVLGSFDGGTATSSIDSTMYIDSVIQLHDPAFAGLVHEGNVIKDLGANGMVDEAWDNARVGEVTYNGVVYPFAAGQNVLTIPTAEGTLYVGRNGDYLFKPSAPDGSFSGDSFSYRLVDQDGDWSDPATVRLLGSDAEPAPVAYDNVAQITGNTLSGNALYDQGPAGSIDRLGEAAHLTAIIYNGVEYAFGAGHVLTIPTVNGGQLVVNDNGNYVYTPPAAGHAPENIADQFTYTVSDASGNTSSATVHLFSEDMQTHGTMGHDVVDHSGSFLSELIETGAGDDFILAGSEGTVIFSGTGNDVIMGGAGDDTIYGGEGDNLLMGEAGNDFIQGGSGNDVIYGGSGNDTLIGGGGSDIFAWSADDLGLGGTDTIQDFTIGQDKLRFDNLFGNPDNITMDDVLAKLSSNELSIQASSGKLDVSVGGGTVIEIHSSSGSFDSNVLTAANGDDADKAQLLLQLLNL
jgi:Ca2+-binding RTX toxin-like protein